MKTIITVEFECDDRKDVGMAREALDVMLDQLVTTTYEDEAPELVNYDDKTMVKVFDSIRQCVKNTDEAVQIINSMQYSGVLFRERWR